MIKVELADRLFPLGRKQLIRKDNPHPGGRPEKEEGGLTHVPPSALTGYFRPHLPSSAWTAHPASALSRHCFEKISRTWDTCSGFRLRAFATSS